ncbi:MAG: arginine decarboxylase [Eubacterium sp.]|nr:arginine decarboxylase [Eubacterium sp.]
MIISKTTGNRALLVHEYCEPTSLDALALDKLCITLREKEIEVIRAYNAYDAQMLIVADPMIKAILLDWELGEGKEHEDAVSVIQELRNRAENIPVFLMADRTDVSGIPTDILKETSDFIWLYEDTAEFIGGRIEAAIENYEKKILPPMFSALKKFADVHEYSWHTPGHTGGTAFMKSPAGRDYFDYYGENMFRSDLSISVGDLGSLLDHSGPIGASEKYAARVFGAHRTYHVTNGSSTSNRIIFMACVTRDQVALCDRNCHKSIEQAMTMSGAVPEYMMPLRNYMGIIGPIPPEALKAETLKKSIGKNALIKDGVDPNPVHAIVTNSTYDGLCYNVRRVEELLGQTVDRMHFDEAWYGYARFNPIYKDRFAMFGDPKDHKPTDMTVFATQSTHKLLAALSQASFIHIREGKKNVNHERFNESFMMQASTSPNYAIIASNDISAAMMDGKGGKVMTDETIQEAIAFRQLMAKMNEDFAEKGEWFFNCWQPETIKDKEGGKVAFYKADPKQLATDPECWVLHPGEAWHGFGDLEDGYCMLDPIKVSITTPGISPEGLGKTGIPASVLSAYLEQNGIVPEKTTDFTVLMLFSIGITKGKWGTLIDTLLRFKDDYDNNRSLAEVLPEVLAKDTARYGGMGLKDLCQEMFDAMKKYETTRCMAEGFASLPHPDMSPAKAYEELVLDHVERVTLDEAAGKTLATGIVPYPPGIPLIMPGENAGAADGPQLAYLKSLESFDREFPGFEHDSHGVESENGKYYVMVLKKQ